MGIEERRAREFQRREQDILSSALDLFTEMGVEPVTIENIAERAEIGKGTIYKHFKSKDEIYAHFIIQAQQKLLNQLEKIDPTLEIEEQLRTIVKRYLEVTLDNPKMYRVMAACEKHCQKENLSDEIRARVESLAERSRKLISGMLRRGVEAKRFRQVPISYLSCAGWGMIRGTIELLNEGHFQRTIPDRDDFYNVMVDILVKGILDS